VLLEYFCHYVQAGGRDFDLVLAGSLELELPRSPFIRYVGIIDGQEKCDAITGAAAVVSASQWDCLSMLACEAWSAARPLLVTARAPVVSSLCARANAGAVFADASDFASLLRRLTSDPAWADECGRHGRAFIAQHYSWDAVLMKLRRMIDQEYTYDD
jgi:glycosyltransferase involved in cell wall biosynthesis